MKTIEEDIGGRTRTRTLDPLIKSQLFHLLFQPLNPKPQQNWAIGNQSVISEVQTTITPAPYTRHVGFVGPKLVNRRPPRGMDQAGRIQDDDAL